MNNINRIKPLKISSLVAIDPGSIQAGISFFYNEQLVTSEQLKLSGKTFYSRLRSLQISVAKFLIKYRHIEHFAVETPFIGKNPQSGLKLGQARGIILGLIFKYNCNIIDVSPQEVRKMYGVKNNAKKEAYQKIVALEHSKKLLGIDEMDAIAIGITAIHKIKQIKLLDKANSIK